MSPYNGQKSPFNHKKRFKSSDQKNKQRQHDEFGESDTISLFHEDNGRSRPKKNNHPGSSNRQTTHYSSDKKSFSKSSTTKTSSSNFHGRSSTNHMGQQAPGRRIKFFNPSNFIKKVEEQAPSPTYIPKHAFSDFLIEEQLKKNIVKRGYTTPTPIQDQAIPPLLEGKDVIGTANTGTGKTAAFLIPLINNLLTNKTKKVLIITPTRELATQIRDELKFFKQETGFTAALCIGGLNINPQLDQLDANPEFVIGTPGRLKDLELNYRALNFSHFTSIVLDEVDTMLDMGFINDMKYIINKLPQTRHSFSFQPPYLLRLKQ